MNREDVALVRAEWRRLFARRITRVMMVLVVLMLGLAAFGVGSHSHPHTPATLAHAEAFIAGQRAQNLDLCLSDARAGRSGPEGQPPPTEADCEQQAQRFQPSVEEFQGYQFTFDRDASTMLVLFGGLLTLFGFVVGASFIGGEWTSGGLALLLVWRPRRRRVLAGKLVALTLGVLAFAAVASIVFTAVLWAVARARGGAGGVTLDLVTSLALRDGRALALAAAGAAAGFAIACYGRHASAALGTALGYLIVNEAVLRIVLSAAHIGRPERFYLSSYVVSWLNLSTTFPDEQSCAPLRFDRDCQPVVWTIGAGPSAALLLAILAVALVAAFGALRRRDVT